MKFKNLTFKKRTIIVLFLIFTVYMSVHAQYEPGHRMRPDDVTVVLTLQNSPSIPFTRHIRFIKQNGLEEDVAIVFNNRAGQVYTGSIDASDKAILDGFVEPKNRSFWDTMYFINKTDNEQLDIKDLTINITYSDRDSEWEETMQIASETNIISYPSSYPEDYNIKLDDTNGREEHVRDKFHWSERDFDALAITIKAMIADIGKSGSSDSSDSKPINPQYGLEIAGNFYCGEFVSWYFYEAGYKLYGDMEYDFESPGSVPGCMGDWFREAGLKYEYVPDKNKFYKQRIDKSIDYDNTIVPKPGDGFARSKEGHAMMLLNWDEAGKIAYVIDGPYPVSIRTVNMEEWISEGHGITLNRYTYNKDFIIGKTNITQTGSIYWQAINYDTFFYDPIVIMGIPSYNGNQPTTVRVKDIDRAGFMFQIDEWTYLDGQHTEETIDYLVYEKGCHILEGKKIEAGDIAVDERWTTVTIKHDFTSKPIVLAQCVTRNEATPVTVRIRNVTVDSFEVRLQEEEGSPDGGNHAIEEVHYILYEQDGSESYILSSVTDLWFGLPPQPSFTSYLFGTIQTFNGPDPCTLRQDMASPGYYDIKIEEETSYDSETGHPFPEEVGIVHIQ